MSVAERIYEAARLSLKDDLRHPSRLRAAPPSVYVSSVDTAKLIRCQLKARWPETRFSVRTEKYSGGSSIHVRWSGDPHPDAVRPMLKPYEGLGFDPTLSCGCWLMPDGSASFRSVSSEASDPEAIPVKFGVSWVFAKWLGDR